jgi:hypothetical protein
MSSWVWNGVAVDTVEGFTLTKPITPSGSTWLDIFRAASDGDPDRVGMWLATMVEYSSKDEPDWYAKARALATAEELVAMDKYLGAPRGPTAAGQGS